jgi:hypothetical protein
MFHVFQILCSVELIFNSDDLDESDLNMVTELLGIDEQADRYY